MSTTKANLTEFEQQLVGKAVEAMEKAYWWMKTLRKNTKLIQDIAVSTATSKSELL